MSAGTTLALRPGDVVAQRYEVERVLGVGGMGAVVAARDRRSGGAVAIKALLPEHAGQTEVMARFAREARATARLTSEHVPQVFGSGSLPSGVPYIVMELLEGLDLKSLVKTDGPLAFTEAAAYVCQASVALAEAHALGIVHRDLKPANLFLARRAGGAPVIKVLDFGIAKFSSPSIAGDHLEMTRARAVLGSRAFMAPEQMVRPREVDARADVWALGAILYYLVTGKAPFAAETTEAVILRVAHDAPRPLADLRPDAPTGFEAVMLRCLAKAREQRWPDVTELARALAPFARDPALGGDGAAARRPRWPAPSSPSVRGLAVTTSGHGAERSSIGSAAPTKVMRCRGDPERAGSPLRRLAGLALGAMGLSCAVMTAVLRLQAPHVPPAPPVKGHPAGSASLVRTARVDDAPMGQPLSAELPDRGGPRTPADGVRDGGGPQAPADGVRDGGDPQTPANGVRR